MSKTATPPPKKTTTATSGSARKTAKPTAKRAPAKPATVSKPKPSAKTKASDKSYKEPSGNRRVSQGLPKGLGKPKAYPAAKNPTKTQRKPDGSPPLPAQPPAPLPREGFRRATVTLTATLEGPGTHQNALQAHKSASAGPRQGGAAHGTQGAAHTEGHAAAGMPPNQVGAPDAPAGKPLTFIEQRYCFEYVQDGNQTRAYMRASGTTHFGTAATAAYKLMKKDEIRAQIEVERAALQARAGVSTEDWLRLVWGMCKADPRELVEYFVGACRYCHGEGHLYHRTDVEFDRDRKEFETHGRQRIDGMYLSTRKKKERAGRRRGQEEDEETFEEQGGPGYDPAAKPHERCPQCQGNGHGRTIIKDTRLLSPEAALLYAGVKEGKEGIEVKMHSRLDALEKLAKFLGAYDADNRQKKADDPFMAMLDRISGPSAALPINPNPQEGNDS